MNSFSPTLGSGAAFLGVAYFLVTSSPEYQIFLVLHTFSSAMISIVEIV
jgi:hypothetical protein